MRALNVLGLKVWGLRRIRRRLRWVIPGQRPHGCCWHHQIDWRRVADVAVRLVRQAQAAGVDGEAIGDYVMDRADLKRGRDRDGLLMLVGAEWLYQEGQHRDQGVARTIVQRVELRDPVTGQFVSWEE